MQITFVLLSFTISSLGQHQKTYDSKNIVHDDLFTFQIDNVSFSKNFAGETADGLFMIINIAFSHKKGINCMVDRVERAIKNGYGLGSNRYTDSYSVDGCYLSALKIFDSEGNEFNKWANFDMMQKKEYMFPTELKPKIKYYKTIVFEVPSSNEKYTLQYWNIKGEYINIKIRR